MPIPLCAATVTDTSGESDSGGTVSLSNRPQSPHRIGQPDPAYTGNNCPALQAAPVTPMGTA